MSPFLSVPYPQPAPDITHGSVHHLCSWTFSSHALKNKFLLPITRLSADDTGIDTLSTFTCSLVPILHGRVGAQGAKPRPETFPLAVAQRTRMFRPCRSCSRWPYKMQLLTASGISHLYLEREAALHANTWNRSERRSWAVTEGPFTPGWLHKSSLDGRWLMADFVTPRVAAGPQRSTHRNHLRSGAAWPPATAAEPTLCARWEAREEEMAASSAERRRSPGARVRAVTRVCSSQSWTQTGRVFLRCLTHRGLLSSHMPHLQVKARPSAGRCHTLMRLPPAALGLSAHQPPRRP